MKKIIMILMMMITFVGFAENKPKDNYDYDKYVGYYTCEDEVSISKEIRKLKNGKYILIDYTYMYGSGYNGKLPYFKLISKNGIFYDKNKIQYFFKDNKLIIDYGDEKYAYKKDSKQEVKKFTSGYDYKIAKFYDGDKIKY